MSEKNYLEISQPYDGLLQRENDLTLQFGVSKTGSSSIQPTSSSPAVGSGNNDGTTQTAGGSVATVALKGDGNATDVWIKSFIRSANWKPKKVGFYIDGSTGYAEFANIYVAGSMKVSSGSIGGFEIGDDYIRDSLDTMGISSTITGGNDVRFWAGSSFASRAAAPFHVLEDGQLVASNVIITGGIIDASALDGLISQGNLDISNQGWHQTCVFSVTDADTIAWSSGSFVAADGTTYSISAGNTGNMTLKTYIYINNAVSTTTFLTTTTASTAVGAGKVLIAVAESGATLATYQTTEASVIVGDNIIANTINASKLSVTQLSAISADLGVITAGTIVLPSGGYMRSGQTAYDSGTGFYIGNDSSVPKFSIGNSSGNKMTWNGTVLSIVGAVTGSTINIPDATTPLFSVDSSGNVKASSLERNDFHWFTCFESLDGYTKVEGGTISLASSYLSIATSAGSGNNSEFQKFLPAGVGLFSWDKNRKMKMAVSFREVTSVTGYLIQGNYSAVTDRHYGFKLVNNTLYGTCADGTTQTTLSLRTVVATLMYTLEAKFFAGDRIEYYVNGDLLGTITTNIPTGGSNSEYLIGIKYTTNTTAIREVRISYFDFWQSA